MICAARLALARCVARTTASAAAAAAAMAMACRRPSKPLLPLKGHRADSNVIVYIIQMDEPPLRPHSFEAVSSSGHLLKNACKQLPSSPIIHCLLFFFDLVPFFPQEHPF